MLENIDISSIEFDKKPYWERGEEAFDPKGKAQTCRITEWMDRSYAYDEDDLTNVCHAIEARLKNRLNKLIVDMNGIEEYTPQFTLRMLAFIFDECFADFRSYRSRLRLTGGTPLFKHYKRIAEEVFYGMRQEKIKGYEHRTNERRKGERAAALSRAERIKQDVKRYTEKNKEARNVLAKFRQRGIVITMAQGRNYLLDRGHLKETSYEMAEAVTSGEYKLRPPC